MAVPVVFPARTGTDVSARSQAICFGIAPVAGLALLVVLSATVGLDTTGWVAGIAAVTVGCWLVGRAYRRQAMSAADLVTFTRFVLAVGVTALVADSLAGSVASFTFLAMPADNAWAVVALASVALALDGVDGAIARRTGTSSATGARFDMEADAYLILVLSVGLVPTVGPWVVAIGLARYVFVVVATELPWLRRPLPPSMARKIVCVQQGVTLTVAAAPVVPWWVALLGCAAALVGLSWSFGRDVAWLAFARRRPQATEVGFQTAVAPASPARTTRTSATIPAIAESAIEMR
jgi:phosphatidylglycerophosphate synthase